MCIAYIAYGHWTVHWLLIQKNETSSQTTQSNISSQQSRTSSTPRGGRAFYRTRVESGIGVRIDEDSGRTVFNVSMYSML